jgi:hypothetical protein
LRYENDICTDNQDVIPPAIVTNVPDLFSIAKCSKCSEKDVVVTSICEQQMPLCESCENEEFQLLETCVETLHQVRDEEATCNNSVAGTQLQVNLMLKLMLLCYIHRL